MSRWKKGYAIEHMPEVWINFLISVARGVGIRLSAGMRSSAWSLMDGCGTLGILGVCSDLNQKWAFFWSKSEIETPETPETRGTPETLWAHGLLMPEIFFESRVFYCVNM